ncbi:MAG TPA: T9SS type A sorting domain-containing protein, partial [Flavobacteriaceae bacterium]|nr:T9SS type A sorting domain-containing protein [Flavobacteriaceae bacterium]
EDTAVNTLVAQSRGEYLEAIGTSDGKTFVVFWANVGAPTNYELRVQLLDSDGTKLFGDNGMLLSDNLPMSSYTVTSTVSIDANDNLYIGATGTDGGNPAFAFKIDTDGNKLWGQNGINVGTGNIVTVLPLASGEAIVSWFGVPEVLMQKYDATGNAIWSSPKPVVNGGNATVPANMYELSDGSYVMVFHSVLSAIYSNLFAQRFDANGDPIWTSPVQLSDKTTTFNSFYSGAQDGDVIYYGYMASSGTRFDSFLQRIDSDGSLPWGINGMDFDTNETNYEMYTQIASEPGSQYVWSICSYTDASQSNHGEYIQKFNKDTGARQFTDTAKELYAIGSEIVHSGKLQLINDQPLFLLKSGMDNGASPVTLHAVKLDAQGDFAWPEETLPVATFAANKSRIHFTKPVTGQSVAVFVEQKASDTEPKIYAQNLTDPDLSTTTFASAKNKISYSNPIQNFLVIHSSNNPKSIEIFDITGRKIFAETIFQTRKIEINSSSWNAGIYMVEFTDENGGVQNFKIIKR